MHYLSASNWQADATIGPQVTTRLSGASNRFPGAKSSRNVGLTFIRCKETDVQNRRLRQLLAGRLNKPVMCQRFPSVIVLLSSFRCLLAQKLIIAAFDRHPALKTDNVLLEVSTCSKDRSQCWGNKTVD